MSRARPVRYTSPVTQPVLDRRRTWTVVIVATLTMAVSYVDRTTLGVLATDVMDALHMTKAQYGWVTSAFSWAYLVATPLSGWWLDRTGARRGLTRSVLFWSSIAALHALVPGFAALFCFRILLGVAEGPGFPGAAQSVRRMLPPAERARGFGVLFTGSSIGGMLTPPLAGYLNGQFGWRVAFLGTALVGLVWVPAWIWVTRRADVRAQIDQPGADEAAAANEPALRFVDLIRHPTMIRGMIAVFCASPIVGFVQSWAANYLTVVYKVPTKDVGHYLWLPPLWFDLGAIAFGDLAARTRHGTRPPRVLFGTGIVLASTVAALAYSNDPAVAALTSPWGAMAVMSVALVGSGALWTLVTADLMTRIPPRAIALAGGTLAASQALAYIIANPLIGKALDLGYTYQDIAGYLVAWLLPGTIAWIVWRPADRLERKAL